jgi:chromatin segregation and condensation protein Rec8/ScpA/Scc1 (kleisin family)
MTLLAGLELTRRRRVKLRQVEMFSELWMYPGAEADGGDGADGAGQADDGAMKMNGAGGS